MRKKGFTLIELLAVIVILAVIALIATPIILNIIEKARKSAFKDSAYGIKATAEAKAMENVIEGTEIENTYQFPFEELKFSGSRPAGGTIAVDKDGKVSMAIHNNKWCAVKEKEETEIRVIDYEEETCKILGIVEPPKPTLKNPEEIMTSEAVGENGAIKEDTSGNKRYAGSNPNNYVCFGTEEETCSGKQLWRIIGVVEGNLKLISTEYYSTGVVYDTANLNSWIRPATLNVELQNNVYENIEWINSSTQKEWITNDRWKIRGLSADYKLSVFETAERNSSFTTSNHIGLMTVTDFGYASSDSSCTTSTILTSKNMACMRSNWLKPAVDTEWTLTPSTLSYLVFNINVPRGAIAVPDANVTSSARPVIILDSDVKIVGGTGTESDPYLLGK